MATLRKRKRSFKFMRYMKKKLFAVFLIAIIFLLFLVVRLAVIGLKDGNSYEKIVLSQQEYTNTVIPFRRGDIVDRKGTVLATSTDVYNVILDCSVITSEESYLQPTLDALHECFGIDESTVRDYITSHKSSQYYILKKKLSYSKISKFEKLQKDTEKNPDIKGVWFEKEYVRQYPYQSLASSLIGFTTAGNVGIGGIEDYYNSVLNGTDGREYGYLNSDSNYEKSVKNAVNGETVVSTIDVNIQSIVEAKIAAFNKAMGSGKSGAKHIGVIVMDPNDGEVLAMANYPNFDLSNPWDLSAYYSEAKIKKMTEKQKLNALNKIWQNFCISYTYEPGSTAKPFTISTGLDTGTLTGNETFSGKGSMKVSGQLIHSDERSGYGTETVAQALANSDNVALMQMGFKIGASNFTKYQEIFNFGLKTNIDLPGEARTADLIYTKSEMTKIDLATNAFGQNFNVTMIQMISAFSSLVNGGDYYLPHVVSSIADEDGNTVETVKPTLLRKTIAESTSEKIKSYMKKVITDGTGKAAKVDGYSMIGKTGTAQKLPRGNGKYLVSFIGAVPADNPKVAIYVVIDEPNAADQAHSTYAQNVAREILKEVLPYMNIYPDEKKTGANKTLGIASMPN